MSGTDAMPVDAVAPLSQPVPRERADSACERWLSAIGDVAERLVGDELSDDTLDEVLGIIGTAADVSRVRIFRMYEEAQGARRTVPGREWCAAGVEPASQRTDLRFTALEGAFKRWGDAFAAGKIIAGITREFPLEEQRSIMQQRVRSLALVPMYTQHGAWGFIGFDDCESERQWSVELIGTLRILGRMLGTAFERTDYRQRQRVLEASHHALLDNLNEAVFKTDSRGHFTYLNAAWRTLTGRTPEEAVGRFCGQVVGPADRRSCRRELLALLRGEMESHRCEVQLLRADGTTRWAQISVRRLDGQEGSGLVGTIVDISANKLAEEQLLAAKHAAEAANRAKSEFLSTMSHELRTPLNAVIGLSESLLELGEAADTARTRRYLELIHGAGQQLFGEINDILDLARIEAGRLKLTPALVDVGSLCAATIRGIEGAAQAKNLQLTLNRPEQPLIVHADERLLGQALRNLAFNAVKFTPAGGRVTISAERKKDGAVTIAIADTGIGIRAEELHLLFKPFSQLDSSLARRFGGTGLGLVLVDKFIRMHGGTVTVESQPVVGSTFTLVLPASASVSLADAAELARAASD